MKIDIVNDFIILIYIIMSIKIPLHDKQGIVTHMALISPEDEENVKKYNWHHIHNKYACGWINGRKMMMHHFISGKPEKGYVIDHINHNGFDNRRENIKFRTRIQNNQNRSKNPKRIYYGITFDKRGQKWIAKSQGHSLGYYESAEEAAIVYDKYAYAKFGEHAQTNGLISYNECKNINPNDLIKINKHKLSKYIYQKSNKFYVHREIYHQVFQSDYYQTLEEAEKWLEMMQPHFQKIFDNKKLVHLSKLIIRNTEGQAIIECNNLDIIVDDDLWYELMKHSWCIKDGYPIGYVNGKTQSIYHYVMQLKGHDLTTMSENNNVIDHINGIRHDNRYVNLRINNLSGNAHNRLKNENATSKYSGVSYDSSRGKWLVQIGKDHKKYFIGRYETEIEAAKAYNMKAFELYGEMAHLNIIKEIVETVETDSVTVVKPKKIQNHVKKDGKTSKYFGVYYDNNRSKWSASVTKDNKKYNIGRYVTEAAAAAAYNAKSVELFGKYARLNKIESINNENVEITPDDHMGSTNEKINDPNDKK